MCRYRYSVNDGVTSVLVGSRIVLTMEQLLRRILELPSKPAVVMVQVPHVWAGAFEPFYHTRYQKLLGGALGRGPWQVRPREVVVKLRAEKAPCGARNGMRP